MDNEAAVGCGARYALAASPSPATSHARPGTTRRAQKRGGPRLLPITSLAWPPRAKNTLEARAGPGQSPGNEWMLPGSLLTAKFRAEAEVGEQ